MIVGFGVLLGIRDRAEHQMPEVASVEPDTASRGDAGTGLDGSAGLDGAAPTAGDGTPIVGADGGVGRADGGTAAGPPEKLMDRPLRVIGLGWELIAPGIVANHGTSPGDQSRYAKAGLDLRLRSSSKLVDLERALARGGGDEAGADVAIIPLPLFVAAYERLRALSPKIFFVLGWSHGQEVLMSFRDDPLLNLPPNRDVQMLSERATAAHLFGLFVLDTAGVAPDRVELVDPGDQSADSIDLAALTQAPRGQPPHAASRRFLLTTADANRFIPYVAIAPEGLIESEEIALRALCSIWLEGVSELRRDVPAAARRIASLDGSPEALELLGSMGRFESSTLRENAEVAALSGRHAVTVNELFHRTWRLWREVDVVTSAAPEQLPFDGEIIAALIRAGSAMADDAAGTLGEAEQPRPPSTSGDQEPLLIHRVEDRRFEDNDLVSTAGFLTGVFGRSPLKVVVTSRDSSRAQQIVEAVEARYGIAEGRLSAGRRVTGRRSPAAVEILPPP